MNIHNLLKVEALWRQLKDVRHHIHILENSPHHLSILLLDKSLTHAARNAAIPVLLEYYRDIERNLFGTLDSLGVCLDDLPKEDEQE